MPTPRRSKKPALWFDETPLGIVVKRRPSFAEYSASVMRKARVYKSMPWVIGDLLNLGEEVFGEDAPQAWDFDAWADKTCANYKSTAKRVPLQRRRADLPFTTHEVVAALPANEQRKWLKLCALNGWTRDQLRDELAKANGEPTIAERREAKERKPETFGELIDAAVEMLKRARSICGPSGRAHWLYLLDLALEAIQKGRREDEKPPVSALVTGRGASGETISAPLPPQSM